jgi:hypothetical protein
MNFEFMHGMRKHATGCVGDAEFKIKDHRWSRRSRRRPPDGQRCPKMTPPHPHKDSEPGCDCRLIIAGVAKRPGISSLHSSAFAFKG